MPQFLIHPDDIKENHATLRGEEVKHLVKVLRYKIGDMLWVSDGEILYLTRIESLTSKEVILKLLESHKPILPAPSPALAIALLKHDHLEWVIQKGVELGTSEFYLFISERTIPHYREGATPKKLARFEKIALEAAKQSGMVAIPKIHPPLSLQALTQEFKKFSAVVLAWEQESDSNFHSVFETLDPTRLLTLIGPEGGFSAREVAAAEKEGAKKVGLGRQILRAETAAIALLTLCQYELGNI